MVWFHCVRAVVFVIACPFDDQYQSFEPWLCTRLIILEILDGIYVGFVIPLWYYFILYFCDYIRYLCPYTMCCTTFFLLLFVSLR